MSAFGPSPKRRSDPEFRVKKEPAEVGMSRTLISVELPLTAGKRTMKRAYFLPATRGESASRVKLVAAAAWANLPVWPLVGLFASTARPVRSRTAVNCDRRSPGTCS